MNTNEKNRLKLKIFNIGIDSINRITKTRNEYICPICEKGFTIQALGNNELNLEHVPPDALGGIPLTLTCYECNTEMTSKCESELIKREKILNFIDSINKSDTNCIQNIKLELDDMKLSAKLINKNGIIEIYVYKQYNDPLNHKKLITKLNKNEPFKFNFIKYYNSKLSNIAELKIAFLYAFAQFGYRFALNEIMKKVRNQLRNINSEIIPIYWYANVNKIEKGIYEALGKIDSMIVVLGRSLIFFPLKNTGIDYYEELYKEYKLNEGINYTMTKIYDLPNKMNMLWDI